MNIRKVILETILEFEGDLKKQCIVLCGLPGSGKTTFVKSGIIKQYISQFKNYNIVNSDNILLKQQYEKAKQDFDIMNNAKDEDSFNNFIKKNSYINNSNSVTEFPVSYEWFEENKSKGFAFFYKTFFPKFYSNWFEKRDLAISDNEKDYNDKITVIDKSANILVLDTTAAHAENITNKFLKPAQFNGFQTNIVYLDLDIENAIKRDSGRVRNVGKEIIKQYDQKLKDAIEYYKKEGESLVGGVDRLLHFIWDSNSRKYILKNDFKYYIQREKNKLRK